MPSVVGLVIARRPPRGGSTLRSAWRPVVAGLAQPFFRSGHALSAGVGASATARSPLKSASEIGLPVDDWSENAGAGLPAWGRSAAAVAIASNAIAILVIGEIYQDIVLLSPRRHGRHGEKQKPYTKGAKS